MTIINRRIDKKDCAYIMTGSSGFVFIPIKDRFTIKRGWCKRITKIQATSLLKRMYNYLEKEKVFVVFKKEIHSYCGLCSYKTKIKGVFIVLNPRKPIVTTALHEVLHAMYSEAEEKEVFAMGLQMTLLLTDKQLQNFILKILYCIKRDWKDFNVFKELGEINLIRVEQKKTKDAIQCTGEGKSFGI